MMTRVKFFLFAGGVFMMIAFLAHPSVVNAARARKQKPVVDTQCIRTAALAKNREMKIAAQLFRMAQIHAKKEKQNRDFLAKAKDQHIQSLKAINAKYANDRVACRVVRENAQKKSQQESRGGVAPSSNPSSDSRIDARVPLQLVSVRINGASVTPAQLDAFQKLYGREPVPGDYWYDARSGLYGPVGGPSVGYMAAGLDFGPLSRNASNGNTGVFLNGREIPVSEWALLSRIVGTYIQQGSYWVDASGNAGIEGSSVPLVNLFSAGKSAGGGGSDRFWSSHFSAGNTNAEGTAGYVSVPGYGPVGYGF